MTQPCTDRAQPVPPDETDAELRGERLHESVRLVVSPAAGRFRPRVGRVPGGGLLVVDAGEAVGTLDALGGPVRVDSPFHGRLMGMLAHPGERLRVGQPVAWLHEEPARAAG